MLLFPPLLLSLLWLLLEGGDPAFWYSFPLFLLSSPEGVFSALFCSLVAAVVLWQLGSMLRYFLRCRAAVRSGGEMPVPSARQARLRGTGEFLLLIAYVLLLVLRLVDMSAPSYPVTYFPEERDSLRSRPVIMAEDVGLPPGEVLGRLEETGSPAWNPWHAGRPWPCAAPLNFRWRLWSWALTRAGATPGRTASTSFSFARARRCHGSPAPWTGPPPRCGRSCGRG